MTTSNNDDEFDIQNIINTINNKSISSLNNNNYNNRSITSLNNNNNNNNNSNNNKSTTSLNNRSTASSDYIEVEVFTDDEMYEVSIDDMDDDYMDDIDESGDESVDEAESDDESDEDAIRAATGVVRMVRNDDRITIDTTGTQVQDEEIEFVEESTEFEEEVLDDDDISEEVIEEVLIDDANNNKNSNNTKKNTITSTSVKTQGTDPVPVSVSVLAEVPTTTLNNHGSISENKATSIDNTTTSSGLSPKNQKKKKSSLFFKQPSKDIPQMDTVKEDPIPTDTTLVNNNNNNHSVVENDIPEIITSIVEQPVQDDIDDDDDDNTIPIDNKSNNCTDTMSDTKVVSIECYSPSNNHSKQQLQQQQQKSNSLLNSNIVSPIVVNHVKFADDIVPTSTFESPKKQFWNNPNNTANNSPINTTMDTTIDDSFDTTTEYENDNIINNNTSTSVKNDTSGYSDASFFDNDYTYGGEEDIIMPQVDLSQYMDYDDEEEKEEKEKDEDYSSNNTHPDNTQFQQNRNRTMLQDDIKDSTSSDVSSLQPKPSIADESVALTANKDDNEDDDDDEEPSTTTSWVSSPKSILLNNDSDKDDDPMMTTTTTTTTTTQDSVSSNVPINQQHQQQQPYIVPQPSLVQVDPDTTMNNINIDNKERSNDRGSGGGSIEEESNSVASVELNDELLSNVSNMLQLEQIQSPNKNFNKYNDDHDMDHSSIDGVRDNVPIDLDDSISHSNLYNEYVIQETPQQQQEQRTNVVTIKDNNPPVGVDMKDIIVHNNNDKNDDNNSLYSGAPTDEGMFEREQDETNNKYKEFTVIRNDENNDTTNVVKSTTTTTATKKKIDQDNDETQRVSNKNDTTIDIKYDIDDDIDDDIVAMEEGSSKKKQQQQRTFRKKREPKQKSQKHETKSQTKAPPPPTTATTKKTKKKNNKKSTTTTAPCNISRQVLYIILGCFLVIAIALVLYFVFRKSTNNNTSGIPPSSTPPIVQPNGTQPQNIWNLKSTYTPNPTLPSFGTSVVAGYDNSIVVGAPLAVGNGAVLVYKYDTSNGMSTNPISLTTQLFGEHPGSLYGSSVAMTDTVLVIGSSSTYVPNTTTQAGAVYVYSKVVQDDNNTNNNSNNYNSDWKISNNNIPLRGDTSIYAAYEDFGSVIAISNDSKVIIVGAPKSSLDDILQRGRVYMFYVNTTSSTSSIGTSYNAITNIDIPMIGTNSYDQFGTAVDISDDGSVVAIGAPGVNGTTGYVTIYKKEPSLLNEWKIIRTLTGTQDGENFGSSVLFLKSDGSRIAIGSPNYNNDVAVDTNEKNIKNGKISIYDKIGNDYILYSEPIIGKPNEMIGYNKLIAGNDNTLYVSTQTTNVIKQYQIVNSNTNNNLETTTPTTTTTKIIWNEFVIPLQTNMTSIVQISLTTVNSNNNSNSKNILVIGGDNRTDVYEIYG